MSEKLIGPPFEVNQSEDSTEPTEAKIVKPNKAKKRKAKATTAPAPRKENQTKSEAASSDDEKFSDPTSPPKKTPPKSPPPRHQGRWIHHQYYNGWDPMLGYMVTNELRSKYVHKGTGDATYEKPADYRSDGSYYFFDSESDEYPDMYTNVSTIRQNDDTANNLKEVPFPTNSDMDMCDPDNHGPDQCHADCPWLGEENLLPDCGLWTVDTTQDGGSRSTALPAVPAIGVPTQETQGKQRKGKEEKQVLEDGGNHDDRGSATYLLSTFVQSDSAVYL